MACFKISGFDVQKDDKFSMRVACAPSGGNEPGWFDALACLAKKLLDGRPEVIGPYIRNRGHTYLDWLKVLSDLATMLTEVVNDFEKLLEAQTARKEVFDFVRDLLTWLIGQFKESSMEQEEQGEVAEEQGEVAEEPELPETSPPKKRERVYPQDEANMRELTRKRDEVLMLFREKFQDVASREKLSASFNSLVFPQMAKGFPRLEESLDKLVAAVNGTVEGVRQHVASLPPLQKLVKPISEDAHVFAHPALQEAFAGFKTKIIDAMQRLERSLHAGVLETMLYSIYGMLACITPVVTFDSSYLRHTICQHVAAKAGPMALGKMMQGAINALPSSDILPHSVPLYGVFGLKVPEAVASPKIRSIIGVDGANTGILMGLCGNQAYNPSDAAQILCEFAHLLDEACHTAQLLRPLAVKTSKPIVYGMLGSTLLLALRYKCHTVSQSSANEKARGALTGKISKLLSPYEALQVVHYFAEMAKQAFGNAQKTCPEKNRGRHIQGCTFEAVFPFTNGLSQPNINQDLQRKERAAAENQAVKDLLAEFLCSVANGNYRTVLGAASMVAYFISRSHGALAKANNQQTVHAECAAYGIKEPEPDTANIINAMKAIDTYQIAIELKTKELAKRSPTALVDAPFIAIAQEGVDKCVKNGIATIQARGADQRARLEEAKEYHAKTVSDLAAEQDEEAQGHNTFGGFLNEGEPAPADGSGNPRNKWQGTRTVFADPDADDDDDDDERPAKVLRLTPQEEQQTLFDDDVDLKDLMA